MHIKKVIPVATVLTGIGFLSACAVDPTVRYVEAITPGETANQPKLIDSYYRQKNELIIELKVAKKGEKPPADPFIVTNQRLEDTTRRIMIISADPFWSKTKINLTKVPDTDLIATASSEVTDQRNEILTSVGSVLKILLPLAIGASSDNKYPCVALTDGSCVWNLPANSSQAKGEQSLSKGLTVEWGSAPTTAIPVKDPSFKEFMNKPQHGIFYSACREVTVRYASADANNNIKYVWRGKVADPNFVDYVAFPKTGVIEFHNQCGVSVRSEKNSVVSTDTLITTAVTQAVAIKDALDKAEEAKDAKVKEEVNKK
ncbi:hypothetical protein [Pseudomonas koreensis]|uniref:Lipoprotein n=1 Tax=Pseudomonas koreensis TaxID=198620 RepID=A0A9X2XE20_9PSED|nr:hypothetical protein [Pseudomonas koreensis]MCU7247252.1 hypothetical protein [Pseudomonas koreensis]